MPSGARQVTSRASAKAILFPTWHFRGDRVRSYLSLIMTGYSSARGMTDLSLNFKGFLNPELAFGHFWPLNGL